MTTIFDMSLSPQRGAGLAQAVDERMAQLRHAVVVPLLTQACGHLLEGRANGLAVRLIEAGDLLVGGLSHLALHL